MKILLIQLSDVHLEKENNIVLDRIEQIRSAIQGTNTHISHYFLVVTGDIAFSGQKVEYGIAHEFLNALKGKLTSIKQGMVIKELFIPGNHDCVVYPEDPVRNTLLDSIVQSAFNDPSPPFHPDDALIAKCSEVQDNFFSFRSERLSEEYIPAGINRLFYKHEYEIEGKKILFNCYNSAWMSRLHEQPGQLLLPTDLAPSVNNSENHDLVVSIFHHPYNWLEPNNNRAFRKLIERSSDVIMTGHEHQSDQYTKRTTDGAISEYFDGAVLQETGKDESGFNLFIIDLDIQQCKVRTFHWNECQYEVANEGNWKSFERSKLLKRHLFENTVEFQSYLNDVGAHFSHPHKSDLFLEDIFVYPDFTERTYKKEQDNEITLTLLRSESVWQYVLDHDEILFIGSDLSGKTAFARKIYADLKQNGITPLLMDGTKLKNVRGQEHFDEVVDRSIKEQYGGDANSRFKGIPRTSKALIIDNFHLSKLNQRGENIVVQSARDGFSKIIVLAGELFQFKEIIQQGSASEFSSFRHCQFREFGYQLRGKMIEKWFNLGQEFNLTHSDREYAHKISEVEKLVSTLLGKSLLPANPIFILTILQQYETQSNLETASGSFGYYYEWLITTALHNRSKRITLDTIYTFISHVAYSMFDSKKKALSEDELSEVISNYQSSHKIRFDGNEMIKILVEAHIIQIDSEAEFRFKYKYIFYYFAARFIKDNLYTKAMEQKLRQQISEMTSKLYVENFANIVIFLVYLTKDEETISEIVNKAKNLFEEYEPFNLSSHTQFLNQLTGEVLPLQIGEESLQLRKEEHRKHLDTVSRKVREKVSEDDDSEGNADEEIEHILRFNVAFKTLQIMGQILRNFPGALKGDTKLSIAQESFLLGLRSMRALFVIAEENFDDVREFLSWLIQEQQMLVVETEEDRKELARRTDQLFGYVMLNNTYGVVKRISYAVGSEHLKEIYKEVQDDKASLSFNIIHTSIKLDHFKQFPKSDVSSLYESLEESSNTFAINIVRRMVRDHFHLFPVERRTMESICRKLNINLQDPKALGPARKKL